MLKILKAIPVFLAAYLICAAWAMVELNNISDLYRREADAYFKQSNWGFALKGDQKKKQGYNKGYKSGGYQHIALAWSSAPPILRPDVYQHAVDQINIIIAEKLTVEEGERIYKNYLGYDNAYLAQIMIRVGDIYLEQGNLEEAIKRYEKVKKDLKYSGNAAEDAERKIIEASTGYYQE